MLKRIGFLCLSLILVGCALQGAPEAASPNVAEKAMVKKEATIALLGATGMVGTHVLEQALAQGYQIRALARTPAKLNAYKNRIRIIRGDARDANAIEEVLRGSDVVISAIGPVKGDGIAAKTISTTTSKHVSELMPRLGVRRYILLSGAAVVIPGDRRNLIGWLVKKMADIRLRDAVKDKQAEYHLLEQSDVQWTLLRCPIISNKLHRREPGVSLQSVSAFSVRAGEVARFALQQIESDEYLRQGPFLYSR